MRSWCIDMCQRSCIFHSFWFFWSGFFGLLEKKIFLIFIFSINISVILCLFSIIDNNSGSNSKKKTKMKRLTSCLFLCETIHAYTHLQACSCFTHSLLLFMKRSFTAKKHCSNKTWYEPTDTIFPRRSLPPHSYCSVSSWKLSKLQTCTVNINNKIFDLV